VPYTSEGIMTWCHKQSEWLGCFHHCRKDVARRLEILRLSAAPAPPEWCVGRDYMTGCHVQRGRSREGHSSHRPQAATFGTPFAGVLFSVEVTATSYHVKNLPRAFFTAVVAGMVFHVAGLANDFALFSDPTPQVRVLPH
jgi:hypothetical protein